MSGKEIPMMSVAEATGAVLESTGGGGAATSSWPVLSKNDAGCRAVLRMGFPHGDAATMVEEGAMALVTDFDALIVGGADELRERTAWSERKALTSAEDMTFPDQLMKVNALIFHWTKEIFTLILALILGPLLAISWGIILAVIKFVSSWVLYPTIKMLLILARPTRTIIQVLLMPVEPGFELIAHMWPVMNFSLIRLDRGGKSNAGSDHTKVDVEADMA